MVKYLEILTQLLMVFAIAICFQSCNTDTSAVAVNSVNRLPLLGEYFSKEGLENPADTILIMASGSRLRTGIFVDFDGHRFLVGLSRLDTVDYIQTVDTTFITAEGARVGMTFAEIRKLTDEELDMEGGWSYFILLPSGWVAAFSVGHTTTDTAPVDSNKVSFIYKRSFSGDGAPKL